MSVRIWDLLFLISRRTVWIQIILSLFSCSPLFSFDVNKASTNDDSTISPAHMQILAYTTSSNCTKWMWVKRCHWEFHSSFYPAVCTLPLSPIYFPAYHAYFQWEFIIPRRLWHSSHAHTQNNYLWVYSLCMDRSLSQNPSHILHIPS